MIILNIILGVVFAIFSGYYDMSLYKKGIMIFKKDKWKRFLLRGIVCFLLCLLSPEKFSSFLVIGSSFWIVFDSYMGLGIGKSIYYTGTQSNLDLIGNSSKIYYYSKVGLLLVSIIIY